MVHWSEIHVDWLKRISPSDFAGRELYLVSQAELHPSYHDGKAIAWVCHGAGRRLHPHLERIGLWRGSGDVVVVCEPWFRLEPSRAYGTLIHELGHAIDNREFEEIVAGEDSSADAAQRDRLKESANEPIFREVSPSLPKWHGHGDNWIRAVIHLIARANIGYWDVAFADPFYGLSSRLEYLEALGDEPNKLASLPICEILKTEPPAAFVELWKRDTQPKAAAV